MEVLVLFVSDQKDGRVSSPLSMPIFSLKTTDQNLETAIMLNIVEKPDNNASDDEITAPLPKPRGEGFSYGISSLLTHCIFYQETQEVFQKSGRR